MKGFATEVKARFIKSAAPAPSFWSKIKPWSTQGAIIAGGAIGAELIAEGAVEGIKALRKKSKRNKTFEAILEAHPELKKDSRAEKYFETLYRFSPSLAADPLGGGAFIRQAIRMDDFGGPSHETIKSLADIEKKTTTDLRNGLGFKAMSAFGAKSPPNIFAKLPIK